MVKREITDSVMEKVAEAIERTMHLTSLVPENSLSWQPPVPVGPQTVSDFGHLLGHLLDCMGGFCAAFQKALSDNMGSLAELRSIKTEESHSSKEALRFMRLYGGHIRRGFTRCTDEDLSRRIPTRFTPQGQTLMTILLNNYEHLTNHKYQLFFYLKLAGVRVGSQDLYKFRDTNGTNEGQAIAESV